MKNLNTWLALLAMTLLTACANSDTAPVAATTTTISGSAVAGAVTGNVVVRTAANVQLTTAVITAGKFSFNLPASALASELDFEVTGTYTDEVSQKVVTLTVTNPLALRTAAGHFTAGVAGNAPITVGSTVIRQLVVNEAKTLSAASNDFYTAFGYTPDMAAKPYDPYTAKPVGAVAADDKAAFRAGMFSQFAKDIGLDAIGAAQLPTAFAKDLSDGKLDGQNVLNTPVIINITGGSVDLYALETSSPMFSRLQIATSEFAGSTNNVAAVTPPATYPTVAYDAVGTTKLVTLSDGITQVNVKLTTANMTPFMQGFWNAHVTHQVSLSNTATNTPIDIYAVGAPITAVNQMPMMWMFSGHHHSSPTGSLTDTTQAVTGNYTMDTYYVMSTAMADGVPMGLWEYGVQLTEAGGATTTVIFHPKVMMAMGGELYFADGSDAGDTWTDGLMSTTPRKYRAWLHSATANPVGGHDLTVFVSTQDMTMIANVMSMPYLPVATGLVLHGPLNTTTGIRPTVNVANVTVEVSTDTGVTWQPLTPVAGQNGQYRVTGLVGLTAAVQNTVQMRLKVDTGTGLTARVDAGGNNPVLTFTAP